LGGFSRGSTPRHHRAECCRAGSRNSGHWHDWCYPAPARRRPSPASKLQTVRRPLLQRFSRILRRAGICATLRALEAVGGRAAEWGDHATSTRWFRLALLSCAVFGAPLAAGALVLCEHVLEVLVPSCAPAATAAAKCLLPLPGSQGQQELDPMCICRLAGSFARMSVVSAWPLALGACARAHLLSQGEAGRVFLSCVVSLVLSTALHVLLVFGIAPLTEVCPTLAPSCWAADGSPSTPRCSCSSVSITSRPAKPHFSPQSPDTIVARQDGQGWHGLGLLGAPIATLAVALCDLAALSLVPPRPPSDARRPSSCRRGATDADFAASGAARGEPRACAPGTNSATGRNGSIFCGDCARGGGGSMRDVACQRAVAGNRVAGA
jgi:hypothetical protein